MKYLDEIKQRYHLEKNDILVLTISLLIGSFMRLSGYYWGGWGIQQPDEVWMVRPAIEMAANKSLVYDTFYYPAQSFAKINAIAIKIHSKLTGTLISEEQPYQFWICRCSTAVFGVLTILLIFLIGNYLIKHMGTIAALFLSVSPYMIIMAKQVTGDVNVCFCGAAVMLLALRYSEKQKLRFLYAMSFVSAFATMEKYHGGATVAIIGLFILLYAKNFKDFLFRAIKSAICYAMSIILIAPNILELGPKVLLENFFGIAEYKNIENGASFSENLFSYLKWGYSSVGGILYIFGIVFGIIIVIRLKDKRFAVVFLGIIKVLILCCMNRAFSRWELELFFTEVVLAAVTVTYLFNCHEIYKKVLATVIGVVILSEGVLAGYYIVQIAARTDQDICVVQEKFCEENGINHFNSASTFYTAYQLGLYVLDMEHLVDWDLGNVLGVEEGTTYKKMDVDYLICSKRALWNGEEDIYNIKNLRLWTQGADYPNIFGGPLGGIRHSYNDLQLCINYIYAIRQLQEGAVTGSYGIVIYDLRELQYVVE